MTRLRNRLAPVLLATALVAVLTGCGADGEGPGTHGAGDRSAAEAQAQAQGTRSRGPDPDGDQGDRSHDGHGSSDRQPGEDAADDDGEASGKTPQALDFTSTTIDGKPFDGSTLAGRPTVLWFWAAWCPTCRGAAPEFKDTVEQFGDKVHFVGVAGKSEPGEMREFVSDFELSGITHLAGEDDGLWTRFEITYQHQYAVLDRDGRVVHSGALSHEELTRTLHHLTG